MFRGETSVVSLRMPNELISKLDDVLVEIDGQTMTRVEMIKAYLDGIKQNKKIDLTFIKPDNQIIEVQLLPQTLNHFEQISSK